MPPHTIASATSSSAPSPNTRRAPAKRDTRDGAPLGRSVFPTASTAVAPLQSVFEVNSERRADRRSRSELDVGFDDPARQNAFALRARDAIEPALVLLLDVVLPTVQQRE